MAPGQLSAGYSCSHMHEKVPVSVCSKRTGEYSIGKAVLMEIARLRWRLMPTFPGLVYCWFGKH